MRHETLRSRTSTRVAWRPPFRRRSRHLPVPSHAAVKIADFSIGLDDQAVRNLGEQFDLEMGIQALVAGAAQCEEIGEFGQAALPCGSYVMDMKLDVDIIIRAAITNSAPEVVAPENIHP